jgi:hypothetical protein
MTAQLNEALAAALKTIDRNVERGTPVADAATGAFLAVMMGGNIDRGRVARAIENHINRVYSFGRWEIDNFSGTCNAARGRG